MSKIEYVVMAGYHIGTVAENMVTLANERQCVVVSTFNETPIEAAPGSTAEQVVAKWDADREHARREYEASPQYAEDQRKARERAEQAETQRRADLATLLTTLRDGDEKALREVGVPFPHSENEMLLAMRAVVNRAHDYGTCVYAMSIAATLAFNYVAHELGTTGFQSSCADMDVLRRTRGYKHGFQILDHGKLLYPQYRDMFGRLTWWALIEDNAKRLRDGAQRLLAESPDARPEVLRHWETIAALPVEEAS